MTKIAFIGGGSVQWAPGLTSDLALTPELTGAQLMLHDIDPGALQRTTPLCKRIVAWHEAGIDVRATLNLREALHNADFVILCVSVGGLAAMCSDLEIPEAHGIRQSVGDTVGPGGLARGLRHIPLALRVARQMEDECPDAWLLNLTNPMTTLCRAITRATGIRTAGLCHEVTGVRRGLASLLDVPVDQVLLEVAGINHLPAITRCVAGGRDGLALLADWLVEHDPFEMVPETSELQSAIQVFDDHWAVKFSLFQGTGVLYGAGDRHVAEFFAGFLNHASDYGIVLTTVAHRQEIHRQRVAELDHYRPPAQRSEEQLAPLVAALLGGPPGKFVLNLPNVGQIDNLPRQAVVECLAYADGQGITPLATGNLPPAAHEAIAGHVDRQELIVEASLSGEMDAARAALAGDPLVHDPSIATPLFEGLMAANAAVLGALKPMAGVSDQERGEWANDMAELNAQTVSAREVRQEKSRASGGLSVAHSTLRELLDDPAARRALEAGFSRLLDHPQLQMALDMTLRQIAPFVPDILTEGALELIDEQLIVHGQAGSV